MNLINKSFKIGEREFIVLSTFEDPLTLWVVVTAQDKKSGSINHFTSELVISKIGD